MQVRHNVPDRRAEHTANEHRRAKHATRHPRAIAERRGQNLRQQQGEDCFQEKVVFALQDGAEEVITDAERMRLP